MKTRHYMQKRKSSKASRESIVKELFSYVIILEAHKDPDLMPKMRDKWLDCEKRMGSAIPEIKMRLIDAGEVLTMRRETFITGDFQ